MEFLSKSLPAAEWDDFQAALGQFPPRCVRLSPNRSSDQLPFAVRALPWNRQGFLLADSQVRPSQFLEYAGGDYYIQEAGSLLAATLADTKPNDMVCDLCAAPGGKASAMLESLGGDGVIVSNEVIGSRVAVLKYNLARIGNPRFVVTNQDSSDLSARLVEQFDLIMVDAPCSGQTLTIKNKRGENAFDLRHIEHAAARQRRILDDAIRMLKVGGRLVYSTCTFADQENEEQMEHLLAIFPGGLQMFPLESLGEYKSPILDGCYRLWPHRHPTAGAFAARMIKLDHIPSSSEPQRTKSRRDNASSKSRKQKLPRSDIASFMEPFGKLHEVKLLANSDDIHGIHASSYDRVQNLIESGILPIAGLPKLVSLAKNTVVPNHDLALMAGQRFIQSRSLDLSDEIAKEAVAGASILKSGEDPIVVTSEADRMDVSKFKVAFWSGRPLGWVKSAGNRWNNLIPPLARLSIGGHP